MKSILDYTVFLPHLIPISRYVFKRFSIVHWNSINYKLKNKSNYKEWQNVMQGFCEMNKY